MLYAILRNVLEERAERSSALDLKSVWQQLREKAASGSGQESPDGRSPMSLRGITSATSPGQVRERLDRRPDGEREVFLGAGFPNLLVEFECFSGKCLRTSSNTTSYTLGCHRKRAPQRSLAACTSTP